VTFKAVPAVTVPVEATTVNVLAPAGLTLIELVLPVMVLVTVSVAVIVRLPLVRRVALKVPVPLVRVVSAGSVAWPSLLVKWTVPE
jgi:hypothetical protein